MENINYEVLFSLIQQDVIVFFEDDFNFNYKKTAIVYSLMRQNKKAQKEMLEELNEVDPKIHEMFEMIIKSLSEIEITDSDVQNIIEYDIESVFEESSLEEKFSSFREIYDGIRFDSLSEDVKRVLEFFGVGAVYPPIFDELFNQYIFKEIEWKDFRVFTGFAAKDSTRFQNFLHRVKPQLVVCIVDNQLRKNEYAQEIIAVIKKNGENEERFVIGAIFSSTIEEEKIDNNIYFELVRKESPGELQAAIVRSAYSYILKKLEYIYGETLKNAFEDAVTNKNIAFYLANMAATEGITNYEVITEWIKLIFEWKLSQNPELYKMIRFTKMINLLDDQETNDQSVLKNIDIFEAFDLNVNHYNQPIASGDIFIVNENTEHEKIYILLGQDCDMMFSSTRPVKNGISEMVEATAVCQSGISKEVEQNKQNIRISNFPKSDNEIKTLEIKYTSRKFIDNQILNLCQFNEFGKCEIDLEQNLNDEKMIMPDYYVELYGELQNYFKAIKNLKDLSGEALDTIFNSNQSPRIIKLHEYNTDNNKIEYPIKRIGRLRNAYTLFLYKMYLEYRGRHPFNTINMSRMQEGSVEIEDHEDKKINVTYLLSPDRKTNRSEARKLIWIIKAEDVNRLLKDVFNEEGKIENKEEIYLDNVKTPFETTCTLNNSKVLIIRKTKKGKLCLTLEASKK